MATIRNFEDLVCWQEGMALVKLVYQITNRMTDFSLKDQIRRAAVSVVSNIAEGFERGNNEEHRYFLGIAKGSCGEVRTQLHVAFQLGFITKDEFEKATGLARRVSALIYAFSESLKVSGFKGLRYKPAEQKDQLAEMLKKSFPSIYEDLYVKKGLA